MARVLCLHGLGGTGATMWPLVAALGQAGQPASQVLDRFIGGLGLPRRLRDVGVKQDDLQRIATNCMLDDWTFSNPRKIHGAQEIVPILEGVY